MFCENCNSEFKVNRQWQRFCSRSCNAIFRRKKAENARILAFSGKIDKINDELDELREENNRLKEIIRRQHHIFDEKLEEIEKLEKIIVDKDNEIYRLKLENKFYQIEKKKASDAAIATSFEKINIYFDKYIKREFRNYEPQQVETIRTFMVRFTHDIHQMEM